MLFRGFKVMSGPKYSVVFVLGGPGAGKGTQCANIVRDFGYVHLSAGDLLRAEVKKSESALGKEIEEHMKQGTIVPVKVTCGLLANAMDDHFKAEKKTNFLIDGFPRNQDNFEGWQAAMSDHAAVKFVLLFDCKEETCVARCLDRGKGGSGRVDDNEETLRKRITQFNCGCKPVIDHYEKLGLVRRIHAEGSADEVFEQVKPLFAQ